MASGTKIARSHLRLLRWRVLCGLLLGMVNARTHATTYQAVLAAESPAARGAGRNWFRPAPLPHRGVIAATRQKLPARRKNLLILLGIIPV